MYQICSTIVSVFFITEALMIWSLLIEIFIALWSADNDYDILYFTVSNTS